MSRIWIEVPAAQMTALGRSDDRAAHEMALAWAMQLYRSGELSSGAAAQLAGIPRVEFLSRLAEFGIPGFDLTSTELQRDLDSLEAHFAGR